MVSQLLHKPFTRLRLYGLAILSILATIGCDCGCKRQIEPEEDRTLFTITTTKADKLGDINKNMLVLDCEGEIKVNKIIGDDLELCLLVTPRDVAVTEAIQAFQAEEADFDKQEHSKPIELPNCKSRVYYVRDLTSGQQGKVTDKVGILDPLPTGDYQIGFIVRTQAHGVYYSADFQPFTIEAVDAGTDLIITLDTDESSLKAKRNGEDLDEILISAESAVQNSQVGKPYQVGFLFVNQSTKQSPESILMRYITAGKALPEPTGFDPLDGNPDVLIYSRSFIGVGNGEYAFELDEEPCNVGVFKQGATYTVCAYTVNQDGTIYALSEKGNLEIPAKEVTLEMVSAELVVAGRYLPYGGADPLITADADPNFLILKKCIGRIVENKGTVNATCGFMFIHESVGDQSDEALKQSIRDHAVGGGGGVASPDKGRITLYTLSGLAKGQKGDQRSGDDDVNFGNNLIKFAYKTSDPIAFPAGTYQVRFWLKDGDGEAFVSPANDEANFTIDPIGGADPKFAQIQKYNGFSTEGKSGKLPKLVQDPAPAGGNGLLPGFNFVYGTNQIGYIVDHMPAANSMPTADKCAHIVNGGMLNPPKGTNAPNLPFNRTYISYDDGNMFWFNIDCTYSQDVQPCCVKPGNKLTKCPVWLFAAQGRSMVYSRTNSLFAFESKGAPSPELYYHDPNGDPNIEYGYTKKTNKLRKITYLGKDFWGIDQFGSQDIQWSGVKPNPLLIQTKAAFNAWVAGLAVAPAPNLDIYKVFESMEQIQDKARKRENIIKGISNLQ